MLLTTLQMQLLWLPGPGTELVIDDSNADGQTQIIWQNATDPDGYAMVILELS